MNALIKALGLVTPRAIGLIIAVALLAMLSGRALAQNEHVRWDIISIDFATLTVSPGGNAFASAQDGSQIKLTGSGTFRSNAGTPQDVTGGGTWMTYAPGGMMVTGSGTYEVTGFVSFELAPGTVPQPPFVLNICSGCVPHAGFAALRIAYSDGSEGVLILNCSQPVGTPPSVPEGISASKGFVDYWHIPTPLPGVDTGRTFFNFLP